MKLSLIPVLIGTMTAAIATTPVPAIAQQSGTVQNNSGLREFAPAGRATNSISGSVTYPTGSRVFSNGTVETTNGQVIPPAVITNHGNGSTTYYYPDGSHIDTNSSTIPPTGTYIK